MIFPKALDKILDGFHKTIDQLEDLIDQLEDRIDRANARYTANQNEVERLKSENTVLMDERIRAQNAINRIEVLIGAAEGDNVLTD